MHDLFHLFFAGQPQLDPFWGFTRCPRWRASQGAYYTWRRLGLGTGKPSSRVRGLVGSCFKICLFA